MNEPLVLFAKQFREHLVYNNVPGTMQTCPHCGIGSFVADPASPPLFAYICHQGWLAGWRNPYDRVEPPVADPPVRIYLPGQPPNP